MSEGQIMFQDEINRGVAWLNENRPGWLDMVELGELQMFSPTRCVLGQTGGYFNVATYEINPYDYGFNLSYDQVQSRGGNPDYAWTAFQDEWYVKIEQLKANHA